MDVPVAPTRRDIIDQPLLDPLVVPLVIEMSASYNC